MPPKDHPAGGVKCYSTVSLYQYHSHAFTTALYLLLSIHTSSPNILTVNQLNSGVALIEYNIIHFT